MNVDVVFLNTAFDAGMVDRRGEHIEFFANNQAMQNAVKVLKLAFYNVRSLPGILLQQLVVEVRDSFGESTSKDVFMKVLHAILTDSGPMQTTTAITEQDFQYDRN